MGQITDVFLSIVNGNNMKRFFRIFLSNIFEKFIKFCYGSENNFITLLGLKNRISYHQIENKIIDASINEKSKIYSPYSINNSIVDSYTYIAQNSRINNTKIGKFCSIGPNLLCGWGIHPTNGISTAPMFYSTMKQNGTSLSKENKIEELKPITIGNDVFIGMNVTILDGVNIGDGAIIGAGAVVSKDIPPYAIAVGNPIKIVKYRFEETIIKDLLKIKWWNFPENDLKLVEQYFWDVETFIKKFNDIL